MPVTYYVRLYREAKSPEERRRIYAKCGKRNRHTIRRRWNPCIDCFEKEAVPNRYRCRVHETAFVKTLPSVKRSPERERRERRAEKFEIEISPVMQRVCIDCKKLFLSKAGVNVCRSCIDNLRAEIAANSLKLTRESVKSRVLTTALFKRFGHAYRPSRIPRIDPSSLGALETIGVRE